MKLKELKAIMGDGSFAGRSRTVHVLPRYAAMCGVFIHPEDVEYCSGDDVEIPDEIVPKILAFDFAERATGDLRAMGQGIGNLKVSIPSNINVWQHVKGETQLANAALALTEAVKKIATT